MRDARPSPLTVSGEIYTVARGGALDEKALRLL